MTRQVPSGVAVVVLAALCVAASAAARAQRAPAGIWDGVYTAAQAERGKTVFDSACIRCHGGDLGGTTAPALKGDRFMATWGGDTLEQIFSKIRDTMPPNFGTILDDSAKLDVVTYILQVNGYPAGERELALRSEELAGVRILRKGEQATVQNFALVQMVGCLARGPNNTWMLTRTAVPAVTRDDVAPAEALAAAAGTPLGAETYLLLSTRPFSPEAHEGEKMEARGLIYREAGDARITLTSLKTVAPTCGG